MTHFKQKLQHRFLASLLVVAILLVGTPISHTGTIQKINAQVAVEEVGPSLVTQVKTTIESTISAANEVIQTKLGIDMGLKEFVLDPLLWGLANTIITNILTELTRWVNSGFQGSPAFVTDLKGFLINAADEAAGDFIEGTELGLLCSPFELDVRIALSIQYYQKSKTYSPQCTLTGIAGNVENFLSGTFSEGGWAGWFELTQGAYNDPNKAFLESRVELADVVLRSRDREFRLLEGNKFFKSIEVCKEGISVNGSIKNCTVTTLGNIVNEQFNHALGIPLDRLAFADEFDELVGALLSQFVNQIFQGVNGLLGMGGSPYSDNSYGSSGSSSYLDAVSEESITGQLNDTTDPIGEAITQQFHYVDLLSGIVALINAGEDDLEAARSRYSGCFSEEMPLSLLDAREDAVFNIVQSGTTIDTLYMLKTEFDSASTSQEQLNVMVEFRTLQSDGIVATELDIVQAELDIEIVLPDQLDSLARDVRREEQRCENLVGNSTNTGGGEA